MGKCNACGFLHPYPGDHTCRFYKEAREKAKQAGDEESWKLYLDIETLENFQAVEEAKSKLQKGEDGSADIKPVLPPPHDDRIADLTRRMDDLATQVKMLVSTHVSVAAASSPSPPLAMAAGHGIPVRFH